MEAHAKISFRLSMEAIAPIVISTRPSTKPLSFNTYGKESTPDPIAAALN